ncbi:hypothetical protein [Phytopseudomonas punonensis]|uniref:Uncharacterized protein n=1 Tax=Phytopseudomonas punonensis TaxID=1220495 RepID=A0A1M7G997_9GAMM|nr:hypothetical protein [Pseudomonas punonensis]SHM12756.1 hypothetical protein SAMN05216288_3108 [Pseudomonas punonensis]
MPTLFKKTRAILLEIEPLTLEHFIALCMKWQIGTGIAHVVMQPPISISRIYAATPTIYSGELNE